MPSFFKLSSLVTSIVTSFAAKRRLVQLKQQWQIFSLALMFFTRIPVSRSVPYSAQRMNQANRYFSLVGLIVGGLVALVFLTFKSWLPLEVTVVLMMIASVLLTGAFHEDGLADMADGIGGGLDKAQRLTIMKDSRIGTYGSVTLLLALLLKFYLLVYLAENSVVIFALICAYGLSRALAASLIFDTDYVSDDLLSKSKPLAVQQSRVELLILFAVAGVPTIFFISPFYQPLMLLIKLSVILVLFRFAFRHWLIARLTGFTGDCLGAAQQIAELLIYLVIASHIFTGGLA